jgi:predicted RNase H-like HicB family nuclease
MADIQARRSASRDSKHDMAYSLANVLNQPSMHILIWEEEGAFIAKCLDIPGCISEGATRNEALANIHDAINLCLSVIREDTTKPTSGPEVELIEVLTSDFLEAR